MTIHYDQNNEVLATVAARFRPTPSGSRSGKRTPEQRKNIKEGCANSDAFQAALQRKRTPRARARAYADAKAGVAARGTSDWKHIYTARLRLYNAEANLMTSTA